MLIASKKDIKYLRENSGLAQREPEDLKKEIDCWRCIVNRLLLQMVKIEEHLLVKKLAENTIKCLREDFKLTQKEPEDLKKEIDYWRCIVNRLLLLVRKTTGDFPLATELIENTIKEVKEEMRQKMEKEIKNETVNEKKMDTSMKIRKYSYLMSDCEILARQLGEEDKEMKEYLLTVARDLHKEIEKLL